MISRFQGELLIAHAIHYKDLGYTIAEAREKIEQATQLMQLDGDTRTNFWDLVG